ncbi:MAG TPA: outer membrane beta-barrel protein [Xanthobacteraceae bacterium]|nr:outer membrane beta-barrel protein [Xanthobacteraceae bacterium]
MRRIVFGLLTISVVSAGGITTTSADILRSLYSPQPVANWAGLYVGGNVGYGWATGRVTGTVDSSADFDGVVGGGQIGGNVQWGNLVFGLEADLLASGQKLPLGSATVAGTTITGTAKLPWFGSARLRAGVGVDRLLIYATGGITYGRAKADFVFTGGTTGTISDATSGTGWVVGGGIEGVITRNFTWRFEYLHFDTTFVSVKDSGVILGTPASAKLSVANDVVRVGLNYWLR